MELQQDQRWCCTSILLDHSPRSSLLSYNLGLDGHVQVCVAPLYFYLHCFSSAYMVIDLLRRRYFATVHFSNDVT